MTVPQIATALPRIVSVFDALDLATWVAAACKCRPRCSASWSNGAPDFLTMAGLMLCVGQLVKTIPIKIVYVTSILVFEIGSVLCGAVRTDFWRGSGLL